MPSHSPTFDTDLSSFGKRVRQLRTERGLSLRWLAQEAGRSYSYLCELELGKRLPSADTLERLADVLGTSMDSLWRGE